VAEPHVIEPAFITGGLGRNLLVRWRPRTALALAEVLIVPPFAEEMNRSRRQLAVTAQAFARAGFSTSILDLSGTGDSDGDFAEATIGGWIEDIRTAIAVLTANGRAPLAIVGLRLGAALAQAALAQPVIAGLVLPTAALILWQPVANGETFLTQILRIRIAAALGGKAGAETTQDLRGRLAAGEILEIAGYPITPALASGLDRLRIPAPPPGCPVLWLEVAGDASPEISPGGERLIAAWRKAGHAVSAATVAGVPFWSLLETETAPSLITASLPFLAAAVKGSRT
jgi:exosortase A-associated hydrolase 2